MSPRAALWLETFGFHEVFDYVAGKAEWLAYGRPVEGAGTAPATVGRLAARDVVTCRLGESTAEVLGRVEQSPYGFGLGISADNILLGRVRRSALQRASGNVDSILETGPLTVRPDLSSQTAAQQMRDHRLAALIVTDPEGRLLGVVHRHDVEDAAQ
jgi:CBS domain-containing protein